MNERHLVIIDDDPNDVELILNVARKFFGDQFGVTVITALADLEKNNFSWLMNPETLGIFLVDNDLKGANPSGAEVFNRLLVYSEYRPLARVVAVGNSDHSFLAEAGQLLPNAGKNYRKLIDIFENVRTSSELMQHHGGRVQFVNPGLR